MPRQARLDSPGTLHHVIVRGRERKNIVEDKYDRKNMISRFADLAEETKTSVYAWALMSNHMQDILGTLLTNVTNYDRNLDDIKGKHGKESIRS